MPVMGAIRKPTVSEIVENTRAIRAWIGWQIDKGKSDEEIARELPLAAAFITGRLSESDLRARVTG